MPYYNFFTYPNLNIVLTTFLKRDEVILVYVRIKFVIFATQKLNFLCGTFFQ